MMGLAKQGDVADCAHFLALTEFECQALRLGPGDQGQS